MEAWDIKQVKLEKHIRKKDQTQSGREGISVKKMKKNKSGLYDIGQAKPDDR